MSNVTLDNRKFNSSAIWITSIQPQGMNIFCNGPLIGFNIIIYTIVQKVKIKVMVTMYFPSTPDSGM